MKYAISITFLYLIGFFLLYTLVAGIVIYDFDILEDKLPYGIFFKMLAIYFGHLALLLIGALLLKFYREKPIHKFFGIFFLGCGIYWVYRVVRAYLEGGYV